MHCGAYSVKAVLEAAAKTTSRILKISFIMVAKNIGIDLGVHLAKVLRNYGLKADAGDIRSLSPAERLHFLKELLSQNTPVMVRIGNGYLPSGKYNPIIGRIIGHWITIWGYDDAEQVFYAYDSAVAPKLYDRYVPTGNKQRTYKEMLRDWRGGLFPWPFWKFVYIKISP